ncbi:MAG: adenosine deaminase [Bacteroidia bacterium]
MDYLKLPKIELHLHLDCSLSYEVVKKLDPRITPEIYADEFQASPKCTDLVDYIKRALKGADLMQTKEALHLVTLDLFDQLKAENVIYAEIRFAPLQHLQEGLTPFEVVETVNLAVEEGIAQTGVEVGIILCTLRHFSRAQSMETVKLVETFQGTHVVGFDIASDEAGFPITNHIDAFAYARERGFSVTAHAGEAKGAESVWETLQHFYPSRIGHGVRSVEDPKLMVFLKEEDIHLEVCPTSNLHTHVVDKIEDHPADRIYNSGVSMSINTDGRTVSNVSLTEEYEKLEKVFAWEKAHFMKCNLEAIRHAFISEERKADLRQRLLAGFGQV